MTDVVERTTPEGIFNYADSYLKAASALRKSDTRATHPDAPIRFLCFHAIELFLKSFLLSKGYKVQDLKSHKFGHKISCLANSAVELGVRFTDNDHQIFSWMSETDVIMESRYIVTGYRREPDYETIEKTCNSVREIIARSLQADGRRIIPYS